jgi:hypothetical protein
VLTFDEPSHTYRYDGVVVPNVTRVIGHLTDYSHIPADALAKAQAEGKAVHRMVEMSCNGILGVIPEWMKPHREAWGKFLTETGFEPVLSEHKVYSPAHRCAGTLDLFGEFRNIPSMKGAALIDVKRSFYGGPAIGLQLAGYDVLLRADKSMPRVWHRFALRLDKDGKYRLNEYEDRDDEAAFLACLQQYRWKQKHYPAKEG